MERLPRWGRRICSHGITVGAGGLILAAAVWGMAGQGVARGDEGSLKPLYEAAQQQAQTTEGAEVARAKYRAIIETHLDNEAVFLTALRRLAEDFEKSDRVEEGIRFFASRVDRMERSKRREAIQEIFAAFSLKHPELMRKVIAELQGSSRAGPVRPASSKEIAQAIVQRADPELRQKALEKLQKMLGSDSPVAEKKTAMATLGQSLTARFDRAPFRPLVVPLLKADDADLRWLAVGCLPGLEPVAEDLAEVARLTDDPAPRVRMAVGSALIHIGKGDRGDVVIPALMKLLRDSEPKVVEETIRSMWGQYASPEFDTLAIELSREPRYHHNVVYFMLSTMRNKSVAVCRRLVEELDDPDWNNSYRAAWGLTYGVPEEAKSLVEEGLLRALPEETNSQTRGQEFKALGVVATGKSRAYLTAVVESTTETEESKQSARGILAKLPREDEKP